MSSTEGAILSFTLLILWLTPIIMVAIKAFRYRSMSDKMDMFLFEDKFGDLLMLATPIGSIVQAINFYESVNERARIASNTANELLKCNNCKIYNRRHSCIRDYEHDLCPYCNTVMSSQCDVSDNIHVEASPKLSKRQAIEWLDSYREDSFNKKQAELIKAVNAKKFLESEKNDS